MQVCWELHLRCSSQFSPLAPQSTAKATARSVKRTRHASAGKPAFAPEAAQNAQRDCQRLFEREGLTIPIPVRSLDHALPDSKLITSYHIKPQDWVKHWMDCCSELLSGWSGQAGDNFESFWKLYQVEHPTHQVYSVHNGNLHNVVPLLIHGDEGRSIKKTNYLVVSIESILGSQEDARIRAGCNCESFMASRPDLPIYGGPKHTVEKKFIDTGRKQVTNFKGHSYLSRWLIFGLGGWIYKKHPEVVNVLLEELATNMTDLFETGVLVQSGQKVYGALIGIKGDLDFHEKYLNLVRSYSHVGAKNKIEICHLCRAGHQHFPFEDFAETPTWSSSMFFARPWNAQNRPALSTIPFDRNHPEKMIAHDLFHIVKVGVARDVIGSVLIYLLRRGFFDHDGCSTDIEQRFKRAHSVFSLWCIAERKSPGLRSFSKRFYNMKNLMSAPWASSKASDSRLLLSWLVWYLKLNLVTPTVDGHNQTLRHMLEVCESTLEINMLHHHGLWLPRACAQKLYASILTALRGYAYLGRAAIGYGIRSFIIKPKHHALHHVAYRLKLQLFQGSELILSPQAFSCDVNEDFIGRISRLSRRVSIKLCDLRVCQRYHLKIAALLKRRPVQPGQPGVGLRAKLAFSKPKPRKGGKNSK